jgi:hypothetical protein
MLVFDRPQTRITSGNRMNWTSDGIVSDSMMRSFQ